MNVNMNVNLCKLQSADSRGALQSSWEITSWENRGLGNTVCDVEKRIETCAMSMFNKNMLIAFM